MPDELSPASGPSPAPPEKEQSHRTYLLEELIGGKVVIDLRSQYVALGTLLRADELFIELKNADLHDLRDTETTRELYVAESRATGIKRNRKRVLVVRADVVAITRIENVVDE